MEVTLYLHRASYGHQVKDEEMSEDYYSES